VLTLGIDPGTLRLGWGLVRRDGNRLSHVEHGTIRLTPSDSLAKRLAVIDKELTQIIARHEPSAGAVEGIFFHKDAQAAAKLGHARGVILLALQRAELEIAEYAPAFVKRSVTGQGRADKAQVGQMVRGLLGLSEIAGHDAADALAIAITHCRANGLPPALSRPKRRSPGRRQLPPSILKLAAK
jgi:crossover junction endodeoxyribonuclease RuvC